MNKVGVKVLRGNKWQVEGDLVLKDEKLRVEIIQLHHDVSVAGHRER